MAPSHWDGGAAPVSVRAQADDLAEMFRFLNQSFRPEPERQEEFAQSALSWE
jgi:hypothetical protein